MFEVALSSRNSINISHLSNPSKADKGKGRCHDDHVNKDDDDDDGDDDGDANYARDEKNDDEDDKNEDIDIEDYESVHIEYGHTKDYKRV